MLVLSASTPRWHAVTLSLLALPCTIQGMQPTCGAEGQNSCHGLGSCRNTSPRQLPQWNVPFLSFIKFSTQSYHKIWAALKWSWFYPTINHIFQKQDLLLGHSETHLQKQDTDIHLWWGYCRKLMCHNAVKSFLSKADIVKASIFLHHYSIFSFHTS